MRHILILLIPLLLAACNEAAPPVQAAEPPDPYAGMSPRDRVRAICEKEYAGESSLEKGSCVITLWKRYLAQEEAAKMDRMVKQLR
jgi:hypothetical protein